MRGQTKKEMKTKWRKTLYLVYIDFSNSCKLLNYLLDAEGKQKYCMKERGTNTENGDNNEMEPKLRRCGGTKDLIQTLKNSKKKNIIGRKVK